MVILLLLCLLPAGVSAAPGKDYKDYHRSVIEAERALFIAGNAKAGLALFRKTLEAYDFVFVDDCIEAFEVALVFKREDDALFFIRKAIANGFELRLLDRLTLGCPCNFYQDAQEHVTIQKDFLARHAAALQRYADSTYPAYLARVNRTVLGQIIARHVLEQTFKNYIPGLIEGAQNAKAVQYKRYLAVSDDNLRFIDSLGASHILPGERLLGIYTEQEVQALETGSVAQQRSALLAAYNLPAGTYVPVQTEADYFGMSFVYTIFHHNRRSFAVLSKYSDEAISGGYLHPREFANLSPDMEERPGYPSLHLLPSNTRIDRTREINALRAKYGLPDYETDYYKHLFAHQHHLKLSFGMFSGTR